MKDFER